MSTLREQPEGDGYLPYQIIGYDHYGHSFTLGTFGTAEQAKEEWDRKISQDSNYAGMALIQVLARAVEL